MELLVRKLTTLRTDTAMINMIDVEEGRSIHTLEKKVRVVNRPYVYKLYEHFNNIGYRESIVLSAIQDAKPSELNRDTALVLYSRTREDMTMHSVVSIGDMSRILGIQDRPIHYCTYDDDSGETYTTTVPNVFTDMTYTNLERVDNLANVIHPYGISYEPIFNIARSVPNLPFLSQSNMKEEYMMRFEYRHELSYLINTIMTCTVDWLTVVADADIGVDVQFALSDNKAHIPAGVIEEIHRKMYELLYDCNYQEMRIVYTGDEYIYISIKDCDMELMVFNIYLPVFILTSFHYDAYDIFNNINFHGVTENSYIV